MKKGCFNQTSLPAIPAETTLKTAVSDLLDSKTLSGLRPKYITSLKQYLSIFIRGRESDSIASISSVHIAAWFILRKEPPATRASNLGRLRSLFSFALRKGWIAKNPCLEMERIRYDQKPPVILTPKQATGLLNFAPKNCLPFVILALLVGVRPDEIHHLQWSDVNLERALLTINRTKTRKRRLVSLHPLAVRWLKKCDVEKPMCPAAITIKRFRNKVKALKLIGDGWPQDILRHSAASYLLALHGDAGKVAMMLGNSEKILKQHYHQLVSPEDCEIFWRVE